MMETSGPYPLRSRAYATPAESANTTPLVMTGGSDFHDIRYNTRGVGMDIDDADIKPFLDLVF